MQCTNVNISSVAKAVTKRVCNDLRCITRNLNFIFRYSIDSTCGEVCAGTNVRMYFHLLGKLMIFLNVRVGYIAIKKQF